MKKIYILLVFLFIGITTYSQSTPVPDAVFEEYLEGTAYDGNGLVLTSIMESQTSINYTDNSDVITTLQGLEACVNLTSLDIRNQDITGFLDLSVLPDLANISLNNNKITSLNISGLDINSVWVPDNGLEKLIINNDSGIGPYAANLTSSTLISGNNITCIQVDDVAAAKAKYTSITDLHAYFTTDCGTFTGPSYTTVPDAVFEAYLEGGAYDADNQVLTTVMEAKTNITITSGLVTNLTGIEACVNLTYLDVRDHGITGDLDLTANTKLTDLYCQNNSIETINLSNLPIDGINASGNGLKKVTLHGDLDNFTSSTFNDATLLTGNNITCFEVGDVAEATAHFTDLDNLYIYFTTDCDTFAGPPKTAVPDPIFEAFLEGNDSNIDGYVLTSLLEDRTSLNVAGKEITSLVGIEACTELEYLFAYDNELTSVDLSANIKLTTIQLNNNEIKALDISSITGISGFNVTNNGLEHLKINQYSLGVQFLNTGTVVTGNNLTCIEVSNVDAAVTKFYWDASLKDAFGTDCFDSSLSVEDILAKVSYSFYPNPFSEILSIQSKDDIDGIVIINLQGQEVLRAEGQAQGETKELDVSHLSAGMYLLKLTLGNRSSMEKIIKR